MLRQSASTDDGSNVKGFVSDILQQRIDEGINTICHRRRSADHDEGRLELTKKYDIPTIVSMNTIMTTAPVCAAAVVSPSTARRSSPASTALTPTVIVNFEEAMRRGKMYHRASAISLRRN